MLAALVLAADLVTSLAVSDRTEVRVRAPGTGGTTAALDLETVPSLELALASRSRWRCVLDYTPRLTLWDVGARAQQPTALQGGEARIEWHDRFTRLSLDQTAGYGGMSFASSPLMPGVEGQPRFDVIPTAQVITIMSSVTTLSSHVERRRWALDTTVGYQLSGGANDEARALLPLQRGPFGEVSASFAATRTDHFITKLSASAEWFSSGPESILAEVGEGWQHRWSRLTETRLTVGAGEARMRPTSLAHATFQTYPIVELALERGRATDGQNGLLVDLRLGPVYNRLTGLVDERAQGTLGATYQLRRFQARALASASVSVPTTGVDAYTLLGGEIGVAYRATSVVGIDAGVRGLWQRQEATRALFLQQITFVGVSLHAPRERW